MTSFSINKITCNKITHNSYFFRNSFETFFKSRVKRIICLHAFVMQVILHFSFALKCHYSYLEAMVTRILKRVQSATWTLLVNCIIRKACHCLHMHFWQKKIIILHIILGCCFLSPSNFYIQKYYSANL